MRRMPAAASWLLAASAAVLVLCALGGAARGAEAAAARPPCWYEVRPGDSLTAISKRFYGSHEHWKKIEAANPGVDWRRLKVGQRLRIPALDGRPPAEAPPSEPTPAPGQPGIDTTRAEGPAQGESMPPGMLAFVAGSAVAGIVTGLLALPISFLLDALLLWWTSRLLRWRMRLSDTSFRRAALATLLVMLLGAVAIGAAAAVSALVFLTGMDRLTATQAWHALTVTLGFAACLWVNCKVLAGVYRTSLLGGLVILLVWTVLGIAASCLLCGLPVGIFALIAGWPAIGGA